MRNNPRPSLLAHAVLSKTREIRRIVGAALLAQPLPLQRGMVTKERVEAVLDRVRPFLHADGGDVVLVAVEGNSAAVRLTGMCAGCPSAHMTLHVGIENALREEIEEFEMLRVE